MKKTKIVWVLVAILVITALLVGCGGGATSIPPTTATLVTTTPPSTTPPTTTPPTTTPPTTTPPTTTTPVTPPSKFSLSTPEASSLQNPVTPEFTWAESKGAETYNLEVATSRSFGNTTVISQTGIKETSYKVNTPLDWDNVYYWRVTAVNKGGQTLSSDAPFWFTTVIPVELPAQTRGLGITPDGKRLIVAYQQKPGKIAIISLEKTPGIIAEIPVKDNPEWVKVSPDGRFAITGSDWLSVINLSDYSVRYIPHPYVSSYGYDETAFTPDGGSVVYANLKDLGITYYLYTINLSTGVVTQGPAIGESAETVSGSAIAITPDGTHALIATWFHNLLVVDLVTGARSYPFLSETKPMWDAVKVTPDGKTAVLQSGGIVWLVDLLTYQLVAEIKVNDISDFAISPDGTKIVGTDEWAYNEAFIISLESKAVTTLYEAENNITRIVITPDGKKAIVLRSHNQYSTEDNMLYVIPLEQP